MRAMTIHLGQSRETKLILLGRRKDALLEKRTRAAQRLRCKSVRALEVELAALTLEILTLKPIEENENDRPD